MLFPAQLGGRKKIIISSDEIYIDIESHLAHQFALIVYLDNGEMHLTRVLIRASSEYY